LVTNGSFEPTTGWTAQTDWAFVDQGGGDNEAVATTAATNFGVYRTVSITAGKKYAITYTITSISAGSVKVSTGGGTPSTVRTTTGTYTEIVTAGSTNSFIQILAGAVGTTCRVDDVSMVAIGAVALYDQTSISETYWYDKANGNDGAVTGASVLNMAHSSGWKELSRSINGA
jgi:hypothetical protein